MADGNGLHVMRGLDKKHDLITRQQAQELVVAECAKVSEWYVTQIPPYVARMIQDALLCYGLIKPAEGTVLAPVPCHCGGIAALSQTVPPFYMRCTACGDSERGAHQTLEAATAGWNHAMANYQPPQPAAP